LTAIFLRGNSRDVLKGLPPDFIHTCVTSPPYFGLRKYQGGEEVWDGDEDCEHEWSVFIRKQHSGSSTSEKALSVRGAFHGEQVILDNTCSKCGAVKCQLGAESSPELYIRHLIQIMQEVRRVLRPDGVFWLNIGDSWSGSWGNYGTRNGQQRQQSKDRFDRPAYDDYTSRPATSYKLDGIKPLDMVLIPEQLVLAARADGWYVRSVLIWAKGVSCSDEFNGNPMPESVNGWRFEKCRVKIKKAVDDWRVEGRKRGGIVEDATNHVSGGNTGFTNSPEWQDCPGCLKCEKNGGYVLRKGSWRPTDSYEQVLMLTKTRSYFCDREAVLENYASVTLGEADAGYNGQATKDYATAKAQNPSDSKRSIIESVKRNGGRNLRSVLLIPVTGYSGAHFAVYNPKLVEPLIKAATSEKGCCSICGSPWARVVDKNRDSSRTGDLNYNSKYKEGGVTGLATQGFQRNETIEGERERSRQEAKLLYPGNERAQQDYINHIHDHGGLNKGQTIGWLPTCSCGAGEPIPCRVLDPFSGAGTTALVCERLGLDSINIDTSAEYIALSEARLVEDEQKRVDGQVKQLRREAKQEAKNRG